MVNSDKQERSRIVQFPKNNKLLPAYTVGRNWKQGKSSTKWPKHPVSGRIWSLEPG